MIPEMMAEYKQYVLNFVLSAIAPETIVAVVAQKTRLKTKPEKSNVAYSEKTENPGLPRKLQIPLLTSPVTGSV